MISLIDALGYQCLQYIYQPVGSFQVLVGPNASGKTTVLDVLAFLGRLVSDGVEAAVRERTENFVDLLWGRAGHRFELAIQSCLPSGVRKLLGEDAPGSARRRRAPSAASRCGR